MSLTGNELQQVARQVADGLSETSSGYPFTEHLRVWKVVGKVFLIITEDDPHERIITVKAKPADGDALREKYSSISSGHYLDKDHWISISSGQSITRSLVKELVKVSYELAREQLPKQDRPQ